MSDLASPPAQPLARRWQWRDTDAWHALVVATLAMMASAGLLYVYYWRQVARMAQGAPTAPRKARHLLVFGKQLRDGAPDPELRARVARARIALLDDDSRTAWLLGGRTGEGPSEAEAARELLLTLGVPHSTRIELEAASAHTLENLRHARELIAQGDGGTVALVSSRYHLARCALMARALGFDYELCAAEDRLAWHPSAIAALSREALLTLWFDIGRRYARLIGHRRMLARVS
jgi:uncharacterized SAM-binding protein YcdF (DUF218 family)